jgi:hypothetical protein
MCRIAAAALPLALGACAVFDPHIPVGPEAGYCYASSRTSQGSAFDGCPAGSVRHVAWSGERTPGISLDESLALLRDRRRRMAEREAELARIDAGTTVAAFAGALAAAGGAILGAANNFVAWTGFAAAGSLAANQGFATSGMRDVYNAGVVALSCVEARALSARIGAPLDADTRPLAAARVGLASALASLEAQPLPSAAAEATDLRAALRLGRDTLARIDAVLAAARGGRLSGPQIATAVYDRTLAITAQVNREIDRATPSAEAVHALARAVGAASVDAKADTAAAATGAAQAAGATESLAASEPAEAEAKASDRDVPAGPAQRARSALIRAAQAASGQADALAARLAAAPRFRLAETRALGGDVFSSYERT